jgi:hypothetical protein
VQPEEIAIVRQRHVKQVSTATDTHTTTDELLEAGFSMRSVPTLMRGCEAVAIQQGRGYGSRGIAVVGRRYQGAPGEDIEGFVHAAVAVICRVCRSVKLLQLPVVKVGPANLNGCIILCVGNLADENF